VTNNFDRRASNIGLTNLNTARSKNSVHIQDFGHGISQFVSEDMKQKEFLWIKQ